MTTRQCPICGGIDQMSHNEQYNSWDCYACNASIPSQYIDTVPGQATAVLSHHVAAALRGAQRASDLLAGMMGADVTTIEAAGKVGAAIGTLTGVIDELEYLKKDLA